MSTKKAKLEGSNQTIHDHGSSNQEETEKDEMTLEMEHYQRIIRAFLFYRLHFNVYLCLHLPLAQHSIHSYTLHT